MELNHLFILFRMSGISFLIDEYLTSTDVTHETAAESHSLKALAVLLKLTVGIKHCRWLSPEHPDSLF